LAAPVVSRQPEILTGQDRLKELAPADGIGNTPTMTTTPPPTRYHRWLGWCAPAMRRAALVSSIGLLVMVVLVWFLPLGMVVVAGWDANALAFLVSIWPIILRADGPHTAQLATRQDETRGTAALLLLGASVASLLGAGLALDLAGREGGPLRLLLIGFAVLTVVVSWTVVNTVYTQRYADLHYRSREAGIAFGDPEGRSRRPTATSPMSPSPSACATRCRTRRCATGGSGAPCSPTPSCRMCSGW
jgi:uncharacterized membrane protein